MKWYTPFAWVLLTTVRIAVSFAYIGQGATLLIISPFGNLYERAFIKVHEQNSEIVNALKKELALDEKAKRKRK